MRRRRRAPAAVISVAYLEDLDRSKIWADDETSDGKVMDKYMPDGDMTNVITGCSAGYAAAATSRRCSSNARRSTYRT